MVEHLVEITILMVVQAIYLDLNPCVTVGHELSKYHHRYDATYVPQKAIQASAIVTPQFLD